jgi:endo-beta-N-acetylglucosaminidase D
VCICIGCIFLFSCADKNVIRPSNPGFETGDLSGWTPEGSSFTEKGIVSDSFFWDDPARLYNHNGSFHFYGYASADEKAVGTLTSSDFTLTGSGKISFLLGAGRDSNRVYVSIHDAETDNELIRVKNRKFRDPDQSNNYSRYTVDLSKYVGRNIYIKLVDNDDDGDFGFINFDDLLIE